MKESKKVGCLICGYSTTEKAEIEKFQKMEFICCEHKARIIEEMKKEA